MVSGKANCRASVTPEQGNDQRYAGGNALSNQQTALDQGEILAVAARAACQGGGVPVIIDAIDACIGVGDQAAIKTVVAPLSNGLARKKWRANRVLGRQPESCALELDGVHIA
jgi:hypothetical protein